MEFTQVGKIINTHGVKGEVKIYPLTDDIYRFNKLKKVYLGKNKVKLEIENVRYHKGLVIIKFKGIDNINEIISFKDDFIYVDEEDRIKLPEDKYFIYDVIGCVVYNHEGEKIGLISDVIQSASNDVYVVKDYNLDKEYLIPAIKEFIIHIDVDNKNIIIDPIEGMIE
ncbi:16S rRNA processing protein RimM [Keratinibaculum paraultunense]|uniref:Ribosome maturation factor RimM n=1 Tax=Keratinibaculum paraultunense TaxID=1278232 RepID=A0A4V2UU81_9FIRM|nr:ribosome maturation factor RimM [Keratinibaculum paraultunense]QQY80755.1 ribosome maturation factor RimM [Keratinibaculum paraultunense]TCS89635.1 16S rRNA processing protein RimM [Keratinibaculum paraultunense]